ncbi:zinc finger domain-containing protein [Cotonvirus japonicus]|uniref:Zinc finger domain-containing protein n=1 Tax=Cotonvirus japonicus TaxID=2811091 RepID=A0ABM7NSU8_9VIRU|nr:zinc finger domain-containing protein [Cotonvirus japonicus]BCS83250.1 zinc finger domain-containing protein [Cotonvirus japonicus]
MTIIAIIKKNKCNFPEMEKYVVPLLYTNHTDTLRKQLKTSLNNYIWDSIKSHVEFIETNDAMTDICNNLTQDFPDKNPDDFFYHTECSYSFPKKCLEIVFCQPTWKEYESNSHNINNVACLHSLKHTVIENNCVVISNTYDLSSNSNVVLSDVTSEDIIRVIKRRYFFSASIIQNNNIIKYYYQNPAVLISKIFNLNQDNTVEKLSVAHFGYNLTFYCCQDKSLYINEIATRINGLYQLHGDVIILNELEENVYANLSVHEIRRLNVLSYGRLYDRKLRENEIHEEKHVKLNDKGEETEETKTPYWSKYIIVNNRMAKWQMEKNKCIECQKGIKTPVICEKCFRVKFCSKQCQKIFDAYHTDECINPKSMIQ